ncbi:MAG: DUF3553 domain-containing protein [Holophagaceae bacterium]|nr:DUF3553 domain-containing protein [Holophagaceae bacterium]
MTKSYYAGMEIDAPCGRCKMETKHRILSITEGTPETLICVNCSSVHKFRPERTIQEKHVGSKVIRPTKATKATSPRAGSSSSSHFQELMVSEKAGTIAKPFGQGVAWEMGMWVDHPSFGLGKIQHKAGRKIDVLFQSGLKTLMAL